MVDEIWMNIIAFRVCPKKIIRDFQNETKNV